jgi:hypothetical protein
MPSLADLSLVESALVSAITAVIYPSGTSGASVTGTPIRIYRGWPTTGPLSLDLAQGVPNISVFPVPGATRNTTRWYPIQIVQSARPTLLAAASGATVTFSGIAAAGQLAGILADNQPFVYAPLATDTPAVVAASLAQAIRAIRTCWLSGTSVTIPDAMHIIGRVSTAGTTTTEWCRQQQSFRITLWCPNPILRDQIAALIGAALSAIAFLTLADGTSGRLRYRSTASVDDDQDAQQYRRDLIYDVEYGTTQTLQSPSMLFGDVVWDGSPAYG